MSSPAISSVLRKVGSSRCLQKHGSEESEDSSSSKRKTVTLVDTVHLQPFSTERYYMLSEIELKSHSTNFLCDLIQGRNHGLQDDASTQDASFSSSDISETSNTSNTDTASNSQHQQDINSNENNNNAMNDDESNDVLQNENTVAPLHLPPCVILYLLWRPDPPHLSPLAYARNTIQPLVQHIINIYQKEQQSNTKPLIYVVVDIVAVVPQGATKDEEEEHKETQVEIAESLIRIVATDDMLQLRRNIYGIVVGLCDSVRAAPGLERCMDAILVGDAERRHHPQKYKKIVQKPSADSKSTVWTVNQPAKSCIGIITECEDDLIGMDPSKETDAVQDLSLHARSCGMWEGKGNIMNFAARAQETWRNTWEDHFHNISPRDNGPLSLLGDYFVNEHSIVKKRRKRRKKQGNRNAVGTEDSFQSKYLPLKSAQQSVDTASNFMVCIVLAIAGYQLWFTYGDQIHDFVQVLIGKTNEIYGWIKQKMN
mmetsp:Transcript_25729/g.29401  ORF Transcript_25729/g.29401 Transcript_25729/m.29401 type:complete len:483 (-) Transcript_25729:66-1514(-)